MAKGFISPVGSELPLRRDQVDGLQEQFSFAAATRCPPEEDRARQEFLKETQTSTLLERFGAGQPFPSAGSIRVGEVDYDMDLQGAIALVREAKDAWFRLPRAAREKYRSWDQLQAAIERGEYPEKPAAAAGGGSPAAAAGSPSDSAAGEAPKGA